MKKPRLFYWEEGCDGWVPVPDNYTVKDVICNFTDMDNEEVIELKFKRIDMTDDEMMSLPEAG